MSDIADDGTLTQLVQAWLGLALGGAKAQEAAFIYQELGDKYTWTVRSRPLSLLACPLSLLAFPLTLLASPLSTRLLGSI